jgi:hypothetical protein
VPAHDLAAAVLDERRQFGDRRLFPVAGPDVQHLHHIAIRPGRDLDVQSKSAALGPLIANCHAAAPKAPPPTARRLPRFSSFSTLSSLVKPAFETSNLTRQTPFMPSSPHYERAVSAADLLSSSFCLSKGQADRACLRCTGSVYSPVRLASRRSTCSSRLSP